MNQEFLLYLQRVLKDHDLESSIDELSAICSRYGIEKQEQLEPDTISGIYHTVLANRQKEAQTYSGSNLATIMRQKFQKKVETEAQEIVKNYQNIPVEIQETVIKTMMTEYIKKNPKIDDFLAEADYAKIAEENIQASQQMLKTLLVGLLVILSLLFASNFLDSLARVLSASTVRTKGEIENVKY